MTVHLVALPHTRLDEPVPTCAYTAKVAKLQRMDIGRELIVYGTVGADVELLTEQERTGLFGPDDSHRMPFWPPPHPWETFNHRAVDAIRERAETGDIVALVGGHSQKHIQLSLPHLTVCEPFVGYPGITTQFCAFESVAWRHHVYGLQKIEDGRWFDTVIPNYFNPDDFPHTNPGDGDYLLYMGRVTLRKGVTVAAEIAERAGLRLIIAGPGADTTGGRLVGDHIDIDATNISYLGAVGPEERAELMAGARALLAPTYYLEPFGGVAVEAMMCGTPVIASDWGAFTETITDTTGFRFTTMQEALDAVEASADADHQAIRAHTIERYSLESVAPLFASWFDRLDTLTRDGWYETRPALTLEAA